MDGVWDDAVTSTVVADVQLENSFLLAAHCGGIYAWKDLKFSRSL